MSVEGQANLGPGAASTTSPVKRGDHGPPMPRGTADTPVRVIEHLAAVGAHSRHVGDAYLRVYESAYGLSGRAIDSGGTGSSGSSTVEAAVTESQERARAQDAVVRATKEIREAEKRLGAALSTLERAIGGRVEELERIERQAHDQRRSRR